MKRFLTLLAAILYVPCGLCANSTAGVDESPNVSLSPQDVPIFYDDNPLTGMRSFTFIMSFLPNREEKRIRLVIENRLRKAGEVICLKSNDMRGFGAGNLLLIQMGKVFAWDGVELPISRISLSVESPITLDKTGVQTFPVVWSINTFLNGDISSISEDHLTKAVEKLINEFLQSYQYVNKNQTKKPLFYIYD